MRGPRPSSKPSRSLALAFLWQFALLPVAYALDLGPLRMPIGASTVAPFAFIEYCVRYPKRCAPDPEAREIEIDDRVLSELMLVQRLVNRSIIYRPDPPGVELSWTENAKIGDCDDYALTKRARLLDAGWPSSALLLATARVPSGEEHIVVVVVTNSGDLVLDNLRPNVLNWGKLPYRWLKRSSPHDPREWNIVSRTSGQTAELKAVCKDRG